MVVQPCYEIGGITGAAGLIATLSGIGWIVGTILSHSPGLSRSTRATGAYMRDYALFTFAFGAIATSIPVSILELVNAYLGDVELPFGCKDMLSFFEKSAFYAFTISGILAGLITALAAVPILGAIVSFIAGILYAPALFIMNGLIAPAAIAQFAILKLMIAAGPALFALGVVAIAVPNRLLKGLGGVLVSFSLVFYIFPAVMPLAMQYVAEESCGALSEGGECKDPLGFIKDFKSDVEKIKEGSFFGLLQFLEVLNPLAFYGKTVAWFLLVMLGGIMMAIAFVAARALAQSIGGVSASV